MVIVPELSDDVTAFAAVRVEEETGVVEELADDEGDALVELVLDVGLEVAEAEAEEEVFVLLPAPRPTTAVFVAVAVEVEVEMPVAVVLVVVVPAPPFPSAATSLK